MTKPIGLLIVIVALVAGTRTSPTSAAATGRTAQTTIEPLTAVITAGISGTVSKVNPTGQLKAGDPLMTLRAPELDAAESARQLEQLAGDIPPAARAAWIESHPRTIAAESAYIQALTDLELAPADATRRTRFAAAARTRQSVRHQIAQSLHQATHTNIATIARQIRERAELKAPADSTVAVLDVRAGDRVTAGQPLALLTIRHQYVAEIVLPRHDQPLPATLKLSFAGTRVEAAVESVTQRRIPFGFRRDRSVATEPVVRLRFTAQQAIAPGTPATVVFP